MFFTFDQLAVMGKLFARTCCMGIGSVYLEIVAEYTIKLSAGGYVCYIRHNGPYSYSHSSDREEWSKEYADCLTCLKAALRFQHYATA